MFYICQINYSFLQYCYHMHHMNRIDSNYTNCTGNSMESPTPKDVLYHIHLLKCHHYIILIHQELVQPSPARLGPPPSTSSRRAVFRRSSSLCCCDRSVNSCNPAVKMLMAWWVDVHIDQMVSDQITSEYSHEMQWILVLLVITLSKKMSQTGKSSWNET